MRSQKIADDCANQITRDTLQRVADNFVERVRICYKDDGGI